MHTLSDVVTTVQKFADSAKFPFEADRYVQVIDDVRDWNLSVLLCWVHFICASSEVCSVMYFRLRTGFLADSVPVTLTGIGGSGAPHYFRFERRVDTGESLEGVCVCARVRLSLSFWVLCQSTGLRSNEIENRWRQQFPEHPDDVILRTVASVSTRVCVLPPPTFKWIFVGVAGPSNSWPARNTI